MIGLRTIVAVEREVAAAARPATRQQDAWTGRFSAHLQTLKPLVSMLARHQIAVDAFEVAHDLEPETAAGIWANAPSPNIGVLAGKVHKGSRHRAAIDLGLWLLQFVVRLRQLKSEVSIDEAEGAANQTLELAGLIGPDEAAAIYSTAEPPADVGAPGD